MRQSNMNIAVLLAFEKGYTIDDFGNCFRDGKQINLSINNNGYKKFNIRNGKQVIMVIIHKMQAFKKYGEEAFAKGICVRHFNGDQLDNSFKNILIGTSQQNSLDIPREKRVLNASNPKHNHVEIIKDYKSGLKYKEIMLKHKISSKGTLSFIINKSIKLKEEPILK